LYDVVQADSVIICLSNDEIAFGIFANAANVNIRFGKSR